MCIHFTCCFLWLAPSFKAPCQGYMHWCSCGQILFIADNVTLYDWNTIYPVYTGILMDISIIPSSDLLWTQVASIITAQVFDACIYAFVVNIFLEIQHYILGRFFCVLLTDSAKHYFKVISIFLPELPVFLILPTLVLLAFVTVAILECSGTSLFLICT